MSAQSIKLLGRSVQERSKQGVEVGEATGVTLVQRGSSVPLQLQGSNHVRSIEAEAVVEGIQPDGSIIDDRDYVSGELRKSRSWWSQAETVVGYLNAYELSGNGKYLDYSINNWNYIRKYLVDTKNGGWFTSVNDAGVVGKGDKGGFWVCPYHNGRMCLEVMERVAVLH